MLDIRFGALGEFAIGVRPAIIGEYLNACLVVHLEQFCHQIADGVITQIRRDITDAQAPLGNVDRGMPPIEIRGPRAVKRGLRHQPVRRRQLQHRIVRVRGHREWMNIAQQGLAVDAFRTFRRRPFALLQAQREILLDQILAVRTDIEAAFHRLLRPLDLLFFA